MNCWCFPLLRNLKLSCAEWYDGFGFKSCKGPRYLWIKFLTLLLSRSGTITVLIYYEAKERSPMNEEHEVHWGLLFCAYFSVPHQPPSPVVTTFHNVVIASNRGVNEIARWLVGCVGNMYRTGESLTAWRRCWRHWTKSLLLIFVNNQLDAQFFFMSCLFLFSTCFGQPCDHRQEN
jgi:hypothetical protein